MAQGTEESESEDNNNQNSEEKSEEEEDNGDDSDEESLNEDSDNEDEENEEQSENEDKTEKMDESNYAASSHSDDYDNDSEEENGIKNLYTNDYVDDEDDEEYVPKKKKTKTTKADEKNAQKSADVEIVKDAKQSDEKVKVSQRIRAKVPSGQAKLLGNMSPPAKLRVMVCCICLVDNSETEDEIVECDNCGVCVHEGCYGVTDTGSVGSTDSSTSTEPWFCDSCKAGATPSCELCPNLGGIFKETDTGKWVHLVCALYIPGIAFGDVEKLSPVTLFEMPYSKWGAKQCSLCEDQTYALTGVCICCDAGMCRNYFHVTCAQMQGLLSQASIDEVHAIADPFFAYCKLHAEKGIMQAKRRNWLTAQSHVKRYRQNRPDVTDKAKLRIVRKLEHHNEKFFRSRTKRPPSWVPTTKMVRYLTTSPSAVRRMMKKAQLMGIITQVESSTAEMVDTRKKSMFAPSFTPDYITYFLERSSKITMLKKSHDELTSTNIQLHSNERILRSNYEQLESKIEKLTDSITKLKGSATLLFSQLSTFAGKTISMPPIFGSVRSPKSPTRRSISHIREHVIHKCGICGGSHEQSMLALCDGCKRHLHLACLKPPLTRMPKKTKLQGWQCSECMQSSSDESDSNAAVDMNAPRKLRETIIGPRRFFSSSQLTPDAPKVGAKVPKSKKKRTKKPKQFKDMPPVLEKVPFYQSPSKSPAVKIARLASHLTDPPEVKSHSARAKRKRERSKSKSKLDHSKSGFVSRKMKVSLVNIDNGNGDSNASALVENPHKVKGHKVKSPTIIPKGHGVTKGGHETATSVVNVPKSVGSGKIRTKHTKGVSGELTAYKITKVHHKMDKGDHITKGHGVPKVPEVKTGHTVKTGHGVKGHVTKGHHVAKGHHAGGKGQVAEVTQVEEAKAVVVVEKMMGLKSPSQKSPPQKSPPQKSPEPKPSTCVVCRKAALNHHSVTCDTCHMTHHWQCLDPPVRKSPKLRGSNWFCQSCRIPSSGDSVSSEEIEPPVLEKEVSIETPKKTTKRKK